MTRKLTLAVLLVLVAACTDATVAHAADISNAGENVGKTVSGWAKWLYAGAVAIGAAWFAMPANRKAGPALVFVAFAIVLGGLVLDPDLAGKAGESLWKTVLE
ncbi:MAG TPA: hypothetical protein VN238_03695 [Solirubrobacteraceae bacterium]|nr:hypothetical protein [Solirubrobacteraceae bacterium]